MRRRVAALVILLVVVALLVWGLSAFARSGKPETTDEVTETPSTTIATEPTVELSTEPTETTETTATCLLYTSDAADE